MLKIISKGDIAEAQADALLICEMEDFMPHQQGMLPAVVWERFKLLQKHPKWVPGALQLFKSPDKQRPAQVAFKSNMKVIFANIRGADGKVSYKSIRDVMRKIADVAQEKLGVESIVTVFPGVASSPKGTIQAGVVRSLLRTVFEEPNVGEPSGLYVEAFEAQEKAEQDG